MVRLRKLTEIQCQMDTYKPSIENTVLDRQTVDGGVEVAMRNFKFGELDRFLVVEQAELQLLAAFALVREWQLEELRKRART